MDEFNFEIKPALFVCDNYQTHDLLWAQNVSGEIISLINDAFQVHFPSLDAIALIERYAPNRGFNYAKDWTVQIFRLYEELGKTGIINNDSLTGKLYFDDAPYQPDKLPTTLGFTPIPDKLTIKVPKDKFAKVSFYERTHEEETGIIESASQSVSIWWRKQLSFVEGEFEIDISRLLVNSLVIEGDYTLIGSSNQLLFYSGLDSTIGRILSLLPTPQILNFWETVITSKYYFPIGSRFSAYSQGHLHSYKVKKYENPNYVDVPDCYSYSCLITANNDFWDEGSSPSDRGKEVSVRVESNSIYLGLWRTLEGGIDYTGNKEFTLDLPYLTNDNTWSKGSIGISDITGYALSNGTVSGYNLLRELPQFLVNNARWHIESPFSDGQAVSITSAQVFKIYEPIATSNGWQNPSVYMSNGKEVSFVDGVEVERKYSYIDKSLLRYISGTGWFYMWGYVTLAEPPWTYSDIGIGYVDEQNNQLSPEVIGYGIAVDGSYYFEDGVVKGIPAYPYNPAFLVIHNSPAIEGNLIQGTTVPVLWDSFVYSDGNWTYQNKSRVYQFNNIFSDHKTTIVSYTSINKTQDRGSNDILNINRSETDGFDTSYHLKRDFYYSALPSIQSSQTQEIKSYIENLSQDDNVYLQEDNSVMPDSPRIKEIYKRLELLSDWMGVAEQPDGTIKTFPDPYHVDSVSAPVVEGLQFAAFGKAKPSDPYGASVYEVLSNRVSKDALGKGTIKEGGFVKIFNLPQLIDTLKLDFGKALGVQESGGILVPKGDNSGTVLYESQLAMQVDQLYTLSRMTKSVNELIIQAARSQAQLQSLLVATGCTIIPQKIPIEINGKVGHTLVGTLHPQSTTIMGEIGVLKSNLGALVGGTLTRQPTIANFS